MTGMYIGICKITLHLHGSQNLKNKRRIVNSVRDRLQKQFPIAIAEVDHYDLWQLATLGLACVSNDSKIIQQTLSKIMAYLESITGEFELSNCQQEIINIF